MSDIPEVGNFGGTVVMSPAKVTIEYEADGKTTKIVLAGNQVNFRYAQHVERLPDGRFKAGDRYFVVDGFVGSIELPEKLGDEPGAVVGVKETADVFSRESGK